MPVQAVEKVGNAPAPDASGSSRLGENRAQQRAAGSDHQVAVLDDFDHDLHGHDFSHGEFVEQVLLDASGLSPEEVERYQIGKEPLRSSDIAEQGVDHLIEDNFVSLLDSTSDSLETILQDDDIRVITQSQSVSDARVTMQLLGVAGQDPQAREALVTQLGLSPDCSEKELAQALADRVDQVHADSQRIKAAQSRYDDLSARVDEQGIVYTVSAGNDGEFARHLDQLGVQVDEDFHRSAFDNGHNTVVGASDGQGNPASFTTPDGGAEVAMDGVAVEATVNGEHASQNGTSFSTPLVAALTLQMLQLNPNLSDEQVEEILKASGQPGHEDTLGAGQVDPNQALTRAATA